MTDGHVAIPLLLDTWEVVLSTANPKTPIGVTAGTMGLIGKKKKRSGQWDGWCFYQSGTCSPRKEGDCKQRQGHPFSGPQVPNLPSVFEQVSRVMSDQGVRRLLWRRSYCSTAVYTQYRHPSLPWTQGHIETEHLCSCSYKDFQASKVYQVSPCDSCYDFVCSLLSSKTVSSRELPDWSSWPGPWSPLE